MVDVAEATEVTNGCVLGLPVVSRLVTAVPVVLGASLGVGRSWVPMERTSLGFAAGATAEAGAEATKEVQRAKTTGIMNGIVQERKGEKTGCKSNEVTAKGGLQGQCRREHELCAI